jgi:LysR family glycine cleavage system transcriptional activator
VSDREVDVFVAFGTGNWPGMASMLLAEIEFAPYCSPRLVSEVGGRLEIEHLERLTLLHMGSYDDWTRWFAACGRVMDSQRGIIFPNMYLVLSAAIASLGVAIGDNLTCMVALAQGQLTKPFPLSIRSFESYYIVAEPTRLERPIARLFADWLRAKLGPNFASQAGGW